MATMESIRAVSKRIAAEFQPEQIILFGSHAYGTAREDSDVDLLVVMPFEGMAAYKAVEILNSVDPPFPVDLLVRRPEELEQRIALNDWFLRDIVTRGQTLYAAPHHLSVFAVIYRYPGAFADRTVARDALKRCQNVRQTIRTSFGFELDR
jgi:predicted nucleotidyltransferase